MGPYRGRHAARFCAVGWRDIASVADDEHVARLPLGRQLGNDAAIRAGDEQRAGRLCMGQLMKQLRPLQGTPPHEISKIQRRGHSWFGFNQSFCGHIRVPPGIGPINAPNGMVSVSPIDAWNGH
jgi:hypothetical protein